MLDAALNEKCSDPSLNPAIVERFVDAAGAPDPLAITVKAGGRLILVPKPKTPDETMEIVRQHLGKAVVRVGLTQVPAGVGVKDPSELKPDLVDACENLRMGTAMFAKVMRIVAKWYGNPTDSQVQSQIFKDAVSAWRTGEFEGVNVFQAQDPGSPTIESLGGDRQLDAAGTAEHTSGSETVDSQSDPQNTGIRIDLSRIDGQK